jgi:hypothetical protein
MTGHGGQSASPDELAILRKLACDFNRVRLTETAEYDLLGYGLTKAGICDEIVAWIDRAERVKKVILRGQHAGQAAFEMKPRISDRLFYLKVTICKRHDSNEYMLIISAHQNR